MGKSLNLLYKDSVNELRRHQMKLRALDPLLYPIEEDVLYTKSMFADKFYTLITQIDT